LPRSDASYSGFTLTGDRNRSSIFALVAFSDGRPDFTFLKMLSGADKMACRVDDLAEVIPNCTESALHPE
jgi:hypothetical protein